MLAEYERGAPSAVSEEVASPAALTRNEIRERMSGNLCRCGAYNGIVDAIESMDGKSA
jgi:xanthine dehydrogenase YagT iron-sulfur-binding subunit